jgi:hypothetical protein
LVCLAGGLGGPSIDEHGFEIGGIFVIRVSFSFWNGPLLSPPVDGQGADKEVPPMDMTLDYKGHRHWQVRIL